jgi:hypothetical protein
MISLFSTTTFHSRSNEKWVEQKVYEKDWSLITDMEVMSRHYKTQLLKKPYFRGVDKANAIAFRCV